MKFTLWNVIVAAKSSSIVGGESRLASISA